MLAKEDHAPMAPLLHPLAEQPAEDEGGGERLIEGALELVGGQVLQRLSP
jgi:hypothetical protein